MTQPQFIEPSGATNREDRPIVGAILLAIFSPIVFALVYFFWLALDDPPLPIIALVICIACFVVAIAATSSIFRAAGLPIVPAVVVSVFAVPCILFAAFFIVIALAFTLGSFV